MPGHQKLAATSYAEDCLLAWKPETAADPLAVHV